MDFEQLSFRWKQTPFAIKLALFNVLYLVVAVAGGGFTFGGHIIHTFVLLASLDTLVMTYHKSRYRGDPQDRPESLNGFLDAEHERLDRLRHQCKIYRPGTYVVLSSEAVRESLSLTTRLVRVRDIDANAQLSDIFVYLETLDGRKQRSVDASCIRLPEPGELQNRAFVNLLDK